MENVIFANKKTMLLRTEGRISEIIRGSEYYGTVVIKKRVRGMVAPVVFSIKGESYKKLIHHKEMREGDRVRIWFSPVCRKHNERYFTDLSVDKIELLETDVKNLFTVDEETGEILE